MNEPNQELQNALIWTYCSSPLYPLMQFLNSFPLPDWFISLLGTHAAWRYRLTMERYQKFKNEQSSNRLL